MTSLVEIDGDFHDKKDETINNRMKCIMIHLKRVLVPCIKNNIFVADNLTPSVLKSIKQILTNPSIDKPLSASHIDELLVVIRVDCLIWRDYMQPLFVCSHLN